jgi:hypothetical protein
VEADDGFDVRRVRDDAEHPVERHRSGQPVFKIGRVPGLRDALRFDEPCAGDALFAGVESRKRFTIAPHAVMQLALAVADPIVDIAKLVDDILDALGQTGGRLTIGAVRDFVGKSLADNVVAEGFERSDRHRRSLGDDAGCPADHRELGLGLENRPIAAVPPIVDQRQGQKRLAETEGWVVDQEFERIDPAFASPRRMPIKLPLEEFPPRVQTAAGAVVAEVGWRRAFKKLVCLFHISILPDAPDSSKP